MDKIIKSILFTFVSIFITSCCLAAPSNSISLTSATPLTTIQSATYNSNNNEVSSKFNAHTHTDITQLGTVTSGVWDGTAITTQYGGTGQDFSAIASGALIYFNGTGTTTTLTKPASGSILYLNGLTQQWDTIAQGNNGQLLRSNGAKANPSFVSAGKVVQLVYTETGAVQTGSTVLPFDDTIPQSGEGDQYLSLAITPTSSTDILEIDVTLVLASTATGSMGVALFQDAAADAIAAGAYFMSNTGATMSVNFKHYMTAGTTSSTTFKVRAGQNNANTTTVNGQASGREYGGVLVSSMSIKEYLP